MKEYSEHALMHDWSLRRTPRIYENLAPSMSPTNFFLEQTLNLSGQETYIAMEDEEDPANAFSPHPDLVRQAV